MFMSFWRTARWFLLSSGIFIAGVVCSMLVKCPFSNIGDLATWVGAIGTVGALIGAICIAAQQSRTVEQEKRIRARIYAPGLLMRIAVLVPLFRQAALELQNPPGPIESVCQCWANELASSATWSLDEMDAVVCLPNECAVNLALIKEIVRQCEAALSHGGKYANPRDTAAQLLTAIDHAQAAGKELQLAVEQIP